MESDRMVTTLAIQPFVLNSPMMLGIQVRRSTGSIAKGSCTDCSTFSHAFTLLNSPVFDLCYNFEQFDSVCNSNDLCIKQTHVHCNY